MEKNYKHLKNLSFLFLFFTFLLSHIIPIVAPAIIFLSLGANRSRFKRLYRITEFLVIKVIVLGGIILGVILIIFLIFCSVNFNGKALFLSIIISLLNILYLITMYLIGFTLERKRRLRKFKEKLQ